jgi:hypothetical protein
MIHSVFGIFWQRQSAQKWSQLRRLREAAEDGGPIAFSDLKYLVFFL